MALTFYNSMAKRVKTKSQKVLGANSYVCRSYSGKTNDGGGGWLPLSWIGLKKEGQTGLRGGP